MDDEGAVKHVAAHGPSGMALGGLVVSAAIPPVLITLLILGGAKIVGGMVVDHCGRKWRGSHDAWWSSFGDTLLGDQKVTRIMVEAMQAEPYKSMTFYLRRAMNSLETDPDAHHQAQMGTLSKSYAAYDDLKLARDKAINHLHNNHNAEPMT